MTHQIDKDTRVKLKFHFSALAHAICLQRKVWCGWTTVAWIYPSLVRGHTFDYIVEWLYWSERRDFCPNEELIGKRLMSKTKQPE